MGNACSRRAEPVTVPLPLDKRIVLRPEHLLVYEERTAKALREREIAEEQLRNTEGDHQRQLAVYEERTASALREREIAEEQLRNIEGDRQRQLAAAVTEIKEEQAEEIQLLKERLEREAADILSVGGVARRSMEEIKHFANQLRQRSAVDLREAIEQNKDYCRRKKFDLATGHQNNISQLYRLLNEEIAELMAEVRKPTIQKGRVADEANDVLSYALQFVWEFRLEDCIEGGATGSNSSDSQTLSLKSTFPQLQESLLCSLPASKDGSHAFVDLSKLPLLGSTMADSVRAINGDFKKRRMSEQQALQYLAQDISRIVHAVAELTLFFAVDMSTESVCGKKSKNKNYYH